MNNSGGRFQYDEEGGADEAVFDSNLSLNTLRRKLFASECDSSFSSKGNDNESLNATRNTPSPQLLTFNVTFSSYRSKDENNVFYRGDNQFCTNILCLKDVEQMFAMEYFRLLTFSFLSIYS